LFYERTVSHDGETRRLPSLNPGKLKVKVCGAKICVMREREGESVRVIIHGRITTDV